MAFFRRNPSDASLVREVLQGRTQQFAVLVDRYKNLVYSTLLARVRSLDEADDLAQEAFLKAFRHLDTLEDPRKFGPWLRQIAVNLGLSFLRSRSRQDLSAVEVDLPVSVLPDQVVVEKETKELVWRALGQLSEANREVILLFYIEDYSLQ